MKTNAMRTQSAGLCSCIEELDLTIKMLNDRMVHENIPLSEEKRLVKEIKDLEKTRSKVISNAANRAKLQANSCFTDTMKWMTDRVPTPT